jgi:hypothetical protein
MMKEYRHLYTATTKPILVDIPRLTFLAVDGIGEPDGPQFRAAVEALYAVSYAVRFVLKKAGTLEYSVSPLEGLWPDATQERAAWRWTLMIMQPAQATSDLVADAIAARAKKQPSATLNKLRLEEHAEGPSAQILHVGPYRDEKVTIDRLLAYLEENGYQVVGAHHEIYLSNPQRTAPERLKTIIRYPVSRHR